MFDKLDDQEIYFKDKNFKIVIHKFKYDIILFWYREQCIPIVQYHAYYKVIIQIRIIIILKVIIFIFRDIEKIYGKDRFDIIEFIKKSLVKVLYYWKSFFSKNDQDIFLNNSKINISPSGKVWDSYRHCELANYNSPILLPKSNCKVVPGEFEDMKNCIIYETEIINNEFVITNLDNLREKISSVLKDDFIRKQLFDNYLNLIKNYHTRYKRSEYIVNILKILKINLMLKSTDSGKSFIKLNSLQKSILKHK